MREDIDPRAWFFVMDAVARRLERNVRETLAPQCRTCRHEIHEPFHGCGVGKQKTFAAGGDGCARFVHRFEEATDA